MEILTKFVNICRICEKQSTFIDLSHANNYSYVQQFLSCANVTVSTYFPFKFSR